MKQTTLFDLFRKKKKKLTTINAEHLVQSGIPLDMMDKWTRWTYKNRSMFTPIRKWYIIPFLAVALEAKKKASAQTRSVSRKARKGESNEQIKTSAKHT